MTAVTEPSMPSPARSTAPRNPWPCSRCGHATAVVPGAGRISPTAAATMLLAIAFCVAGLCHWHDGYMHNFGLALAALLLLTAWGLRRHAPLRCPHCGCREGARLHHSGPVHCAVAVPTYNNAGTIADVVTRIRGVDAHVSVYVIDDGSTDGTGLRAQQALGPSGRVIRHPSNRGKGAALRTALAAALADGYSHLLTLDGDGQHLPEDIPGALRAIEGNQAAIIVGARDLSHANVQDASRFGRRFSNFWLWALAGARLADTQSGFRVYPTASTLALGAKAGRYGFEVEVLTLAARAGMPLRSVPIRVYYPPPDERVSHFKKLWDNVRISLVNTRLALTLPLWPLGWPARFDCADPPSNIPRLWSGRSLGGTLGHRIFIWTARLFGPWPAYALIYPVCAYYMLRARQNVAHAQQFLGRATGKRRCLARWMGSYRLVVTFARCVLDRALVHAVGPHLFAYESVGREHIDGCEKTGAILLSAHLGNYEIGGALLSQTSERAFNIVMLDSEAEAIRRLYARLHKTMPKVIAINRAAFPGLSILQALRRGEGVAMHGDRIIDTHYAWCDFFGAKAPIPTGVFMLAAAAKVPVVLTFGFNLGPRRYLFVAEPPRTVVLPREDRDAALAAHAQWYASRLEHYARQYPYNWFNFYDFWRGSEV